MCRLNSWCTSELAQFSSSRSLSLCTNHTVNTAGTIAHTYGRPQQMPYPMSPDVVHAIAMNAAARTMPAERCDATRTMRRITAECSES